MWRCVFFGLLFFLSTQLCNAQEIFGKPNVWFFQLTSYQLNKNWLVGNEIHARFDDYLRDPQQLLIRPFVSFHKREELKFSAGYTFITTYPYGAYPLSENLPEHNVWEQVELKQVLGKTKLIHRYRLEQRWIGNFVLNTENREFEVNGYNFRNRFRYRFTAIVDLSEKWFLHFFDELFIRSGQNLSQIDFDRNWFSAGAGYKLGNQINFQLAYMHHYAKITSDLYERHHTLLVSMVATFGK